MRLSELPPKPPERAGETTPTFIVKVALDGSGQTTLATGQANPFGIVLDATHVYWTNMGDGSVMRANLDGTGRVALAQGRFSPTFLAVDAARVYWSESVDDGGVRSVPLTGGQVADLASHINHPWGLAIDGTTAYFDNDDGNIDNYNYDHDNAGATRPIGGAGD